MKCGLLLAAVAALVLIGPINVAGQGQVPNARTGIRLAQNCARYIGSLDNASAEAGSGFARGVCIGLVRGVFDISGFLGYIRVSQLTNCAHKAVS